MAATLTAEQTPFSTVLRESTRDVHERAQRSSFMDALLDGRLPLSAYARLAAQYHFIYQAIEEASDAHAGHPVGGAFVFDELRRGPALAADLTFLVGEDWAERIEPVPATEDYVRRVRTVAFGWPGGLDEAPWDDAERQRIVTEALVAFELNVAVLADLAEQPGA
jgi:heme oxygenase